MESSAKLGSSTAAFWNFFKNMFGAGILVLPHAFESAGLLAGLIVYVLALMISIVSMVLLLRCQEMALADISEGSGHVISGVCTYPGLAHRALGKKGYWLFAFLVVLLELAFCTGWVIVSSHNIAIVIWNDTENSTYVVLCLFPVFCLLSFVKYLRQLWVLSFLGFIVYFFGVMGTSYLFILTDPPAHSSPYLVHWATLPNFFGTAMYSLEAILLVLPIRASMRCPQDAPVVLASGATLYALLAGVFGAVCYSFGLSSCPQGVTDCLPEGNLTTIVRLALSVSMVWGYPCILYPVTEILEDVFFDPSAFDSITEEKQLLHATRLEEESPSFWCFFARYLLRVMEVGLTCLVGAFFADKFNVFANIVGAILIPLVGFVCPALLHAKLCGVRNLTNSALILDVGFVVFGFAFMAVAVSTL